MVTTRAHDDDQATTGDKRAASPAAGDGKKGSPGKKAKVEKHVKKKAQDEGEGAEAELRDDEDEPAKSKSGAKKEDDDDSKNASPSSSTSKPAAGQGQGDTTKQHARASGSANIKPDGMDEDKREEEPEGSEVKGNAGPGELAPETKTVDESEGERKHGVIERGHIYMIYRPKVETNDPESIDDVSKFHMLLVPDGHDAGKANKLHRLLAVGKKHMPDAAFGGRPLWGEVLNVGEDFKALKNALGPSTYETKTRGTRHQPGARVAGAGAYVLHTTENPPEGSSNAGAVYHTHLAYELAVPHEIGEVQEALGIHETGVFTLQVKNPDSESTNPVVGNQPASKHPQFPPTLKHLFTTKFIPANPPSLLNYPGAELLFIPSKHATNEAIGEDAKKELDAEEKEVEEGVKQEEGESEAKKALKEIGLEGLVEGKALEGHWE